MGYDTFYLVFSIISMMYFFFFMIRRKITILNYSDKRFIGTSIVFLSVLSGLRPSGIPDTVAYYFTYSISPNIKMDNLNLFARYSNSEIGYIYLNKLFSSLGVPYRLYLGIVCSMILSLTVYGLYLILRSLGNRERYSIIGLYSVFLLYNGLHNSSIAIRAGLCIGFGLIGVGIYLNNRSNLVFSIALIVFSMLFQTMGILFFVAILIARLKKVHINIWFVYIIYVALCLSVLLDLGKRIYPIVLENISPILEKLNITSFDKYILQSVSNGGDYAYSKRYVARVFVNGLLITLTFKDDIKHKKLTLVSLIGLMLQGVAYPLVGLYRIVDFFMMFLIPLITDALSESNTLTIKRLVIFITTLLLLYLQILIVYRPFDIVTSSSF